MQKKKNGCWRRIKEENNLLKYIWKPGKKKRLEENQENENLNKEKNCWWRCCTRVTKHMLEENNAKKNKNEKKKSMEKSSWGKDAK